jgi:hypothetical protein
MLGFGTIQATGQVGAAKITGFVVYATAHVVRLSLTLIG